MATVTGLTAERMLEIEGASVVSGAIDGSGHLILTTHDGTTIDAGDASVSVVDASTTQAGKVELATSTETVTGTDTVRATTPAGVTAALTAAISAAAVPDATTSVKGKVELATSAETITGTDTVRAVTPAGFLAALTTNGGSTVKAFTAPAESGAQSLYPVGVSYSTVATGSGWTPNSGQGTIITVNSTADRCWQMFFSNFGGTQTPGTYIRSYHSSNGGGGWTSWKKLALQEEIKAPTRQRWTASSATNAIPTGAKTAKIRTWAAGAQGGGSAAPPAGQSAHGGGGQAGGYSESYVDVSAFGGNIAIVIGAAGSGSAAGNNVGGNGGDTTVNSTLVVAKGGLGGLGGGASTATFGNRGGAGTTAGTGDITSPGAPGGYGFGGPGLCAGGVGGSTLVGSGGVGEALAASTQDIDGTAGTGYGSGGGGGASSGGGGTAAGGAGRPGLVIIDFYYAT